MDNYILSLLQFCDSGLPTGAFSHSFGLETYIQKNAISNKETFLKWLEVYIGEQLVYGDGLACRLAYEALKNNELEDIWQLDHMLMAQVFAQESREGNRKIGERLLTLGDALYPSLPISAYLEKVKVKQCSGHPALVFAMIGHCIGVPESTTVLSYLFSNVISLIQNAVRGIPLGQTEGQELIKESQEIIMKSWKTIEKLGIEDFGITPPGLEISQMGHERVNIRIFMS